VPYSMDQHMATRWAAADFEDFMYASGCCKQYASTVSRWTRKNAASANSRAPVSSNRFRQASRLTAPDAPQSGQCGSITTIARQ